MAVTISGTTGVGLVTSDALPFLAGQVCFFAQSSAPDGFLKCNGATVSRTTYDILFAAIGTTYGAGDGSTTFALPDLRGEFLRCLDDGRGVDSSRSLGSSQAYAVESHQHTAPGYWVSYGVVGGDGSVDASQHVSYYDRNFVGGNAAAYGSTETRPRNVALLACIKY